MEGFPLNDEPPVPPDLPRRTANEGNPIQEAIDALGPTKPDEADVTNGPDSDS
jgi:hypothetical protein